MSHIDNVTTIRNIISEREQIKALFEQIVSNCGKELSKNPKPLAKFCEPRFNDPVPLSIIKITQENVRDFCQVIENKQVPPNKQLFKRKGNKYSCTFKNCDKMYKGSKEVIRHLKYSHYQTKMYKCKICLKIYSRFPIFKKYCLKKHPWIPKA